MVAADSRETIEVPARAADARSPEQWARAMFEDAPAPVRWFLLIGWRAGLGLRLGPRRSPAHVLGWPIVAVEPDSIRLVSRSPLLSAELVLRVTTSSAALTTTVTYRRWPARPLWTSILPIHRVTARYLLGRAACPGRGPRRLVLRFQRRFVNPLALRFARFVPGQAVVETAGRHSGLARRTPVGGRLDGTTFWLVSEFGRASNYVRNIEADPNVRVLVHGRWRSGRASIVDDDPARERLRRLPRVNSLLVRLVGTDLLTIRVDLDDEERRPAHA